MSRYRKKPVVVEATQWFKNGDHPLDGPTDKEGKVVRYFRRPDVKGDTRCEKCGRIFHDHGWVETLEGGHIVCPGDWIITDARVSDPRHHGHFYPCKPDIFLQARHLRDDLRNSRIGA